MPKDEAASRSNSKIFSTELAKTQTNETRGSWNQTNRAAIQIFPNKQTNKKGSRKLKETKQILHENGAENDRWKMKNLEGSEELLVRW